MSKNGLLVTIIFFLGSIAFAQETQAPVLNFQSWKDQQVLEAQNQVLRNSARISQLKSEKRGSQETKDQHAAALPGARVKKAVESNPVQTAEKDLKRAQESLEAANALQLDDYINIYLPTLQDRSDALNKLAEKLSKEELAEIFKSLVQKNAKTNDASHNQGPVLEGLTVSSHSKNP